MNVEESLKQFRDDLLEWGVNNIDVKVPISRKINDRELSEDVALTPNDVGVEPYGAADELKEWLIRNIQSDNTYKMNNVLNDSIDYTDTKLDEEVAKRHTLVSQLEAEIFMETTEFADTKMGEVLSIIKEDINNKPSIDDSTNNRNMLWSSEEIDYELSLVNGKVGNLNSLRSSAKDNLVDSINETRDLGINVKQQVINALVNSGLDVNTGSSWDEIISGVKSYSREPLEVFRSTRHKENLINGGCTIDYINEKYVTLLDNKFICSALANLPLDLSLPEGQEDEDTGTDSFRIGLNLDGYYSATITFYCYTDNTYEDSRTAKMKVYGNTLSNRTIDNPGTSKNLIRVTKDSTVTVWCEAYCTNPTYTWVYNICAIASIVLNP